MKYFSSALELEIEGACDVFAHTFVLCIWKKVKFMGNRLVVNRERSLTSLSQNRNPNEIIGN